MNELSESLQTNKLTTSHFLKNKASPAGEAFRVFFPGTYLLLSFK